MINAFAAVGDAFSSVPRYLLADGRTVLSVQDPEAGLVRELSERAKLVWKDAAEAADDGEHHEGRWTGIGTAGATVLRTWLRRGIWCNIFPLHRHSSSEREVPP